MRWTVALVIMAMFGCAAADHAAVRAGVPRLDEHHHARPAAPPSESARRILVLESNRIGRPTEVLGLVDVHEPVGSQEEALAELREHAAELGADAVLGVEFHHGEGGSESTHLAGMAVRFRDLLQGRAYDVLAELDVKEAMGREEEAHAELRRQAGALRADLIIGVAFQHGEGEEPIHLTGTAIRIRH